MPAKTKGMKTPRPPAPRYSIAEWYGKDVTHMTPQERQVCGELATKQIKAATIAEAPLCPFLSTLIPEAKCHKRGGVCSIRRFSLGEHGSGLTVEGDQIATTCPSRFIQNVEAGKSIFTWISEKMLDVAKPTIVKETPFLRTLSDAPLKQKHTPADDPGDDEEENDAKKAGRIDWIVVDPDTMTGGELQWAAIETQALYFSGQKMIIEFEAYAKEPSSVLFPNGKRRPDYRSSGPKRLSPQLDVKVPVLNNWGKKLAVVVDRFFFEKMSKLDAAYSGSNEKAKRDNASVVWFIVEFDENLRLKAHAVQYATLESSRKALNAAEPLAKSDFTDNLKSVIGDATKVNKVFTVSSAIVRG